MTNFVIRIVFATLLAIAVSPHVSMQVMAADSPAGLQAGIDLYNARSYSAAAQYFEESVKSDPRNPTAYYYAALCFSRLGQTQRANDTFSLILKHFAGSPEAKLASSALQQSTGNISAVRVEVGTASSGTSLHATGSAGGPARSSGGRMVTVTGGKIGPNSGSDLAAETLPDSDSVPFTRVGGTIYVNALVNGRPLRMIFDTGADHVQIGLNHVGTLKAAAASGRQTRVQGIGGLSTVSQASAEITLGKITRTCPILIQESMRTEPLLGQTFFSPFVCQFDNGAGLIRFYRRASKTYSAGYDTIEVPYSQSGNNLMVYPKIMIGSTEYKIPMILDTGAERTMVSRFMVPTINVPSDARLYRVSGISGSETVVEVPVQRLELGAISKVSFRILLGNGMFSLLGQDFFGDRKYTVDPEKHVIRFTR